MMTEREKIRLKQKRQELYWQSLEVAPKFTTLVRDCGSRVNLDKVELPICGMITMEEINRAFYAGKTDAWDIVCFLVDEVLRTEPYLKGIRMEVSFEETAGSRTIYLTDLEN